MKAMDFISRRWWLAIPWSGLFTYMSNPSPTWGDYVGGIMTTVAIWFAIAWVWDRFLP